MCNDTLIELETYLELLRSQIKDLRNSEITIYTNIFNSLTMVCITVWTKNNFRYSIEINFNMFTAACMNYIIQRLKSAIYSKEY